MLLYLCWRVQNNLHREISVNFMPPGHTKFAPDWCFGLFKRKISQTEVGCLDDICDIVKVSTPESNIPQLVGREDGTVLVPTYDWHAYISDGHKALIGIKSISHMRFTSTHPGRVYYRSSLAEGEQHKDLVDFRA